jgi:PAS domain S-box-containing protein
MDLRKNFSNYKKSIFIFLAGITLAISMGLLILKNYEELRDALLSNEQKHLLTISDTAAKSIESYFRGEERSLKILAQDLRFSEEFDYLLNDDPRYTGDSLKIYYKIGFPRVQSIELLDSEGLVLAGYPVSLKSNLLKNISDLKDVKYVINNKKAVISEVYFEDGIPYIYLLHPIENSREFRGIVRCKLSIDFIYKNFIEPIKPGNKGYASVKSRSGVFLMHPDRSQVGKNVLKLRKLEYPDYDWSELENLFKKQQKGETGVEVYHSVWVTDEEPVRVKKFNGYAPARIGEDFWIITVASDYNDVVRVIRKNYYYAVIIALLIVSSLISSVIYIYIIREKKKKLEIESMHLNEVKKLNKDLEEDIEKRKILGKELIKSKNKYEAMFNSVSDCMFVVDFEDNFFGDILEMNEKVPTILQYSRDKLQQMKYKDIDKIIGKDSMEKIGNKIQNEKSVLYETELTTKFGKKIPVEINARLFKLGIEYKVILISRDITTRKIQEAAVRRSEARFYNIVNKLATNIDNEDIEEIKLKKGSDPKNKRMLLKLEKINIELEKMFKNELDENKKKEALMIYQSRSAAMGEMIGNIAHQWRQPLSSLSLIMSNIEDSFLHNDVEKDEILELFEKSRILINKMSETIDDFRYFFKPKSEKGNFSASSSVMSTLGLLNERLNHKEIKLSTKLDKDIKIYGHSNQLSQVILNFINNSIDALSEKIEGDKRIDIKVFEEENNAVIEVNDNGGGIEEEIRDRIFEPYFSTKDEKNGTGIGLYMSKIIIEKNFRGLIEVSNKNGGACLKIIIPLGGDIIDE